MRELYRPLRPYGRRGIGNGNFEGTLPQPTTAGPGTPEKVAVMRKRARLGQSLFSPLDSTFADAALAG